MRSSPGSSAARPSSADPARARRDAWTRWGILSALLLTVAIPRFDMWDPGPIGRLTAGAKANAWGRPLDVEGYVRLVGWFRGEARADSMIAPFCYRPLAPAIAAAIPGPPARSLNLLNLAALLATLALLEAIGAVLGFGPRGRWAMGLLFAVSFPTFYYGAIGFIDPVAVAGATLLLLLALRGSMGIAFTAACVVGTWVKETNAAFALLATAGAWSTAARERTAASAPRLGVAARAAVPFIVSIAAFLLARSLLPFPERGSFWYPSVAVAIENLGRPRTYASLLLTLGPVAALAVGAVATGRATRRLGARSRSVLVAGALLAVSLYAYSVASAYTDGRIAWAAYPFLLPLAAAWFEPTPVPKGH